LNKLLVTSISIFIRFNRKWQQMKASLHSTFFSTTAKLNKMSINLSPQFPALTNT
jgi:hypothetical protein